MLMGNILIECRGCLRMFTMHRGNFASTDDATCVVSGYITCPYCNQPYTFSLRKHWEPV